MAMILGLKIWKIQNCDQSQGCSDKWGPTVSMLSISTGQCELACFSKGHFAYTLNTTETGAYKGDQLGS